MSEDGSTASDAAPGGGRIAGLPMAGCSIGLKGLIGAGEAAVFAGGTTDGGGAGTLAGGGKGAGEAPGGGTANAALQSVARMVPLKKRCRRLNAARTIELSA